MDDLITLKSPTMNFRFEHFNSMKGISNKTRSSSFNDLQSIVSPIFSVSNELSFTWKNIFSILLLLNFFACENETKERESRHTPFCNCEYEYEGETIQLKIPEKGEEELLDEILELQGIATRPYKLCKAEIPAGTTAFATIFNDRRYIIYDHKKLKHASYDATYWFTVWLLGHELGHHLNGHGIDRSIESKARELEADRYSGHILHDMGATLQDAISVMEGRSEKGSDTHPPKARREMAVKEGWQNADDLTPVPDPIPKPVLVSKPQIGRTTIGGRKYRTLTIGGLTWMAQDLAYPIGLATWYEDSKWGNTGMLYYITDAIKACQAVGWRLPTNSEWLSLIRYFDDGYQSDNKNNTQRFNKVRAYGALINKGDSGFNVQLGGGLFIDKELNSSYDGKGKEGNYWTSSTSYSYPNQYLYFNFDREEISSTLR